MKDAFIGVMCLLLLVDFVNRVRDMEVDDVTYWMSSTFNGMLLAWGVFAIWRGA